MRDTTPYLPKPAAAGCGTVVVPTLSLSLSRAAAAAQRLVGRRVRRRGRVAGFAAPRMIRVEGLRDEAGAREGASAWLRHTPHLRSLGLVAGQEVAFVARVDRQPDGTYTFNRPAHLRAVAVAE